ncbi:hypothetical protein CERZMDRAFT_84627 [Cercospora zeae-maydis SCOH1-5]|uniref:Uncharacterized protein n=1 Tax=Cercospora zeae-maydis SCOH1-5 TaxID=717836 RepID=A0A6A6FFS9_9PEZI|nr:hypothetical protein CERZMDRAFT_84627 [Cercospora zeae-maydis SCOH1-5]
MSPSPVIGLPLDPATLQQWENSHGDINIILERIDETIQITTAATLEAALEYANQVPDEQCFAILQHCVLGFKKCLERFEQAIAEAEQARLTAAVEEVKKLQRDSKPMSKDFGLWGMGDAIEEDATKLREELAKVAQAVREVKGWTEVIYGALGKKVTGYAFEENLEDDGENAEKESC